MKYKCAICGYVYDEEREQIPFADLPDDWKCPLCGAKKSGFELVWEASSKDTLETTKRTPSPIIIDEDLTRLTTAQLSALCSNLARGCEKQYKPRESRLYTELADYFRAATPAITGDFNTISDMVFNDLLILFQQAKISSENAHDRGALRVCTWGEKVTMILNGLMERYAEEGSAFLEGTEIWVCSICGFAYVGDKAPELCPVCKVPDWKFEKIEGGGVA